MRRIQWEFQHHFFRTCGMLIDKRSIDEGKDTKTPMDHESTLLQNALRYEAGHNRRTQHILKVYTLTRLIGEHMGLTARERRIVQAAAILHDIAIKYCKEHCGGDASQQNQRKAAPGLVHTFLQQAGYAIEDEPEIVELVEQHHDYDRPRSSMLQALIEADLIINCYESAPDEAQRMRIRSYFASDLGKELFDLYAQGGGKAGN